MTGSGAELVRAAIHEMLPGRMLSMYQSLSKAEYPSLNDFLTKSKEVVDRLTSKHKNDQKNNTGSNYQT